MSIMEIRDYYNCLLCFEKVYPDPIIEIYPESETGNYDRPDVDIPKLCEVLDLTTSTFSSEEYTNFKAPICLECDSNIKRISGLLEDLKRIESNLSTLRQGIQTQLSNSILRMENKDGEEENVERDVPPDSQSVFEVIRQKIVEDLADEGPRNISRRRGARVKEEPLPYESDYEDNISNTDFNLDTDSLLDEIVPSESPKKSERSRKKTVKKEPILRGRKLLKKNKIENKKTFGKKIKKTQIRRKKRFSLKINKEQSANSTDLNQLGSTEVNVSRSGRLRRSTTKPDFLYKADGKMSSYVEEELSDENEASASLVKVESGENDPIWKPNSASDNEVDYTASLDDIGAERFSSSESSDESKSEHSDPEDKSDDEEVKPAKIRKTKMKTTKSGKKSSGYTYKHIIDPDLTEAQIRLIGSNKKPMESSHTDKLIVNKNGKKSIDMSSLVKDESIAVLQINEQLFGKRFSCTQEGCRKTFTDKESRDVHVRRKHDKNPFPFVCETCSKAFRQFRTLKRHKELNCQDDNSIAVPRRRKVQVKSKSHLCQYCPEKYRSPSELQIHVRKAHTGETPFKCQYCEQSFISALKLEHHTEQNHDEVAPIKCEYCAKGFFREHRLKIHVVVHTGERPYLCEICCKSFALKNQLTYHQTMHNEQLAYKFRCEECNKNFASPQNLKQHVKSVHERNYRYICEICNHGSAQMSTHRVHMRTHTGEKPFRCHFCEKAYINGSMLKIHLRNHTGERPYVCSVCQKGFTVKSKLDRHELLHKEERPFQCSLCNKGFTTVSYLNSHYKSSHKHSVVSKDELLVVSKDELLVVTSDTGEPIPLPVTISMPMPITGIPVSLPMTIPYSLGKLSTEPIPMNHLEDIIN